MLGERVAVGHAGDEIGDAAGARRLVERRKAGRPFRRQILGMSAIAEEKVANDPRRFAA